MTRPATTRRRHSSLFRRIYGTFVATVILAALLVGTGGWLLARALGSEWVGDALELVGEQNDELAELVTRPAALEQRIAVLAEELDTRIAVYGSEGERLAGDGPDHIPPRVQRHERQLRRGRPVVQRKDKNGLARPVVLAPIVDPETGQIVAVLQVSTRPNARMRIGLVLLVGVLGVLAVGAAALSRSLVRRIAALERGVGRIAGGELQHRVDVPVRLTDEIDELGDAVNEMARRLEQLVQGQRTLLANVSHELRTPLSRIKVLLEILEERLEVLAAERTSGATPLERVRVGLAEMTADVAEIEALIGDLLTSGRLDLTAGEGKGLAKAPCPVGSLLRRVGGRFSVEVAAADEIVVPGDELLLERLFSNLFANARRACPTGRVDAIASVVGDDVVVRVQDEGPGIAPEHRETVFEPFRRLDDARSRDRGGVGLGLHLCRQICLAHGGSITAEARPDGQSGACLVVRLPRGA
ncbi:MAG TPA: HAMP domain-containing sensor histidine kinase [Nannocystaceae bacterium]|nr:HAMP domain-containing sensor histidine kinase [Nannocystaceae bacterium]